MKAHHVYAHRSHLSGRTRQWHEICSYSTFERTFRAKGEAVTVLNMLHFEMEVLRSHTAFLWLVESIHRRQKATFVLSLQMRTSGGLAYPPSIGDADQQPLGA